LVNIPHQKLPYYRGGKNAWATRTIVGKRFTSTPVFTDLIQYLELNPTWTVPYSIATKDILPILKKDPDYLARKNMQLLTHTGHVVDPGTVDFQSISGGRFPYIIRQAPGDDNALGHVKFMFPNPYSVYLHDTPNRSLFGKEERALSYGCIRTEQPLHLAEVLLDNPEKWNGETISKVIASRKTTRVNLPKPYPIIIQYWTHFTEEYETAYFFTDIYHRDPPVLQGLNAPVIAPSHPGR
jgi:murein L,D-transpeptidase YcbB/YkuD